MTRNVSGMKTAFALALAAGLSFVLFSPTGSARAATCPPGEYLGGGVCTTCPVGFFCPGNDTRIVCQTGTYAGNPGSTVCAPCPGDCQTCSAATGGCIDCAADPARWLSGTAGGAGTVCVDLCGTRFRSDGKCLPVCPDGTYALAPDTLCQSCLLGGGCVTCDPYSGDCTLCQGGDYPYGSSCTPCPSGRYGTDGLACQDCAAGTHNATPGATTCAACPPGTASPSGAATCSDCPAGREPSTDRSSCVDCPPGTYNGAPGMLCVPCPPGTYVLAQGSVSCDACAAGDHSGYGATVCSACEPGTYSAPGSGECSVCLEGTYSSAQASSCIPCDPGSYSADTRSGSCSPCPEGTYNMNTGADVCLDCPGGLTSPPGSISLESCAAAAGTKDIYVVDSVSPYDDLRIPFGDVPIGRSGTATVTVGNSGSLTLVVGIVGATRPLSGPFSIANDTCSATTVAIGSPCTFQVVFSPQGEASFADSLDIPSDDPDEDPLIVEVTGRGYLDASPTPSAGGTGGGCFVATAAFGSQDAWTVRVLRAFRDQVLARGPMGRVLIRSYYRVSPPAAAWISKRPAARLAARVLLTPLAAFAWMITVNGVWPLVVLTAVLAALAILARRRSGEGTAG